MPLFLEQPPAGTQAQTQMMAIEIIGQLFKSITLLLLSVTLL